MAHFDRTPIDIAYISSVWRMFNLSARWLKPYKMLPAHTAVSLARRHPFLPLSTQPLLRAALPSLALAAFLH
jgi:hypothetical protein